jgi:signal transduction histidine kinase
MKVTFTNLRVFNQPVTPGMNTLDAIPYLSKSISHSAQANLSFDDSLFSLEFTALNFLNSNNIDYSYRLAGWDSRWINTSHRHRRASYSNIPAGQYQLHVRAKLHDETWGEDFSTMDIIISPAPWQTTGAYAIYVFILGGLIAVIVWRRQIQYNDLHLANNELNHNNQQLQSQAQQHANEFKHSQEQLKQTELQLFDAQKLAMLGRLVGGMAKRLHSPLNVAMSAASLVEHIHTQMDELNNQHELTQTSLSQYCDDTRQGLVLLQQNLALTNHLITHFKLLNVDPPQQPTRSIELFSLLHQILDDQQQLSHRNIEVTVKCDPATLVSSYPELLTDILNQLINNSLEHGFADKLSVKIIITAEIFAQHLLLEYQDNGTGVNQDELDQLFKPFYTGKPQSNFAGLGMTIVHTIVVHQLGGNIRCTSESGIGFESTIKIPLE